MGNKTGVRLDYKQEQSGEILAKAKAECQFTERLYQILLAYQQGKNPIGQPYAGIPPGNVGELNPRMSRLYNQIWSAAMGLQEKSKQKKKREAIAA